MSNIMFKFRRKKIMEHINLEPILIEGVAVNDCKHLSSFHQRSVLSSGGGNLVSSESSE